MRGLEGVRPLDGTSFSKRLTPVLGVQGAAGAFGCSPVRYYQSVDGDRIVFSDDNRIHIDLGNQMT